MRNLHFSPGQQVLENCQLTLRRWPILILLGTAGAVIGLAVSLLSSPRYQSEAVLGVTINYAVTQPLELVVEDRALNRVAAIILADTTLTEVLNRLPDQTKADHGWHVPSDLRPNLRLDQRLAEWGLVSADEDPAIAMEIAQVWAEVAIEELDEAMSHAWRAQTLAGGMYDIQCLPVENATPAAWVCETSPLSMNPEALDGTLQTEMALSRGILTAISYELLRSAELPDSPISWPRGLQVLGGAAIGLLIGAIAMIFKRELDPHREIMRD